LLSQMRAHAEMLEFKVGDRVTFQPEGRPPLTGTLMRYNRKTVTVITDDGGHWNVSPTFLQRVERSNHTSVGQENVIPLHKK